MSVDTQQLQGFDDLAAKLRALAPALRKKVLRNALAAGARLVRDEARRNAPVLQGSSPYRTPGLVRKRISVRTSKEARRQGNVGVFVNVKPAEGARYRAVAGSGVKRVQTRASQRGARSRLDPFYWRFLEFGWTPASRRPGLSTVYQRRKSLRRGTARQIPGRHFLLSGARKFPDAVRVFQAAVGKWMAKVNASGKVTTE